MLASFTNGHGPSTRILMERAAFSPTATRSSSRSPPPPGLPRSCSFLRCSSWRRTRARTPCRRMLSKPASRSTARRSPWCCGRKCIFSHRPGRSTSRAVHSPRTATAVIAGLDLAQSIGNTPLALSHAESTSRVVQLQVPERRGRCYRRRFVTSVTRRASRATTTAAAAGRTRRLCGHEHATRFVMEPQFAPPRSAAWQ